MDATEFKYCPDEKTSTSFIHDDEIKMYDLRPPKTEDVDRIINLRLHIKADEHGSKALTYQRLTNGQTVRLYQLEYFYRKQMPKLSYKYYFAPMFNLMSTLYDIELYKKRTEGLLNNRLIPCSDLNISYPFIPNLIRKYPTANKMRKQLKMAERKLTKYMNAMDTLLEIKRKRDASKQKRQKRYASKKR